MGKKQNILLQISPEHSGWYTCVVGNSEGRREISTFLDVMEGAAGQNGRETQTTTGQQQRKRPQRLQMIVERVNVS